MSIELGFYVPAPGVPSRMIFRTEEELTRMPLHCYRLIKDPAIIERQRNTVLKPWERGNRWEYDEAAGRTILIQCAAI